MLRFSDIIRRAAEGVVFGRNQHVCDVLINRPGAKRVSNRQFTVVADTDGSWYLEDSSSCGTSIGYDGKAARQKRTHDRWIIARPPKTPKRWDELIVYTGDIAFSFNFSNQEAGSPKYVANLEAFIRTRREALPDLNALGLDSNPATVTPSQLGTPGMYRPPIYVIFGKIGRSTFATVYKVMSRRDGLFYAMKKCFRPPDNKKRGGRKRVRDADAWYENKWKENKRTEAKIMGQNAHVSDATSSRAGSNNPTAQRHAIDRRHRGDRRL